MKRETHENRVREGKLEKAELGGPKADHGDLGGLEELGGDDSDEDEEEMAMRQR